MQSSALRTDNLVEPVIPERLIFGRSAAMQEIHDAVERVADVSVPVLLQGERGTGKELIGKEIHRRSPWRKGPFVRVSSRQLTGRASSKKNKDAETENVSLPWRSGRASQNACAGTVFLDEVSELDPIFQVSLLGSFQNEPSGQLRGEENRYTDPRMICATRRNLESEVSAGNFRSDLFYRINIVSIQLPRLRDRKEDIPDLVEYFFEAHCRRQNQCCRPVPEDLLELFCEHDWPGNIRELENCVRRYVNMNGASPSIEDFASNRQPFSRARRRAEASGPIPLKTYSRQVASQAERDMILNVLRERRWNRKEAARVLQISYGTLLQKLKQAGIDKKPRAAGADSSKELVQKRLP